jgi:hypothetical protein
MTSPFNPEILASLARAWAVGRVTAVAKLFPAEATLVPGHPVASA